MSVHKTCTKCLRQRSRNGRNSRAGDLTGRIPFMATKKKAVQNKPKVDERKLEQWKKKGESLGKARSLNQWAIGDWILDGEKRFGNRRAYDIAQKATGMMRATLYQFKDTAECFPISTRVKMKNLYFGHYRLVANNDYTPEQRQELLQFAIDNEESVASFAGHLRSLKKDADDSDEADVAAQKVMDACNALLGNSYFDTVLDKPPTPAKRSELLEHLKDAVAELNSKVKQMVMAWREHDEADETSLPDGKAIGVGAGK
jgi:hypothetical protein